MRHRIKPAVLLLFTLGLLTVVVFYRWFRDASLPPKEFFQRDTPTGTRPTPASQDVTTAGIDSSSLFQKVGQTVWHLNMMGRDGPVGFYAKVVDQAGAPVPGVRATFELTRYNRKVWEAQREGRIESRNLTELVEVISDPQGRIEVTGQTGQWLMLQSLVKDGYILPEREDPMRQLPLWTFGFGANAEKKGLGVTTPKAPFVIPAWKTQGGEPSVRSQTNLRFAAMGEERAVNLVTGIAEEGGKARRGDLYVALEHLQPPDLNPPYVHRLVVRAPDGGVLETDGIFPYQAPESGYAAQVEFIIDPEDPVYRESRWERRLYTRIRRGRLYAGLWLRYTGRLEIIALVNPSGSRNLEPDPAKQITDPEEIQRLDRQTRGEDQP